MLLFANKTVRHASNVAVFSSKVLPQSLEACLYPTSVRSQLASRLQRPRHTSRVFPRTSLCKATREVAGLGQLHSLGCRQGAMTSLVRHVSVDASDVKKGHVIEFRGAKYVVMKTSVNITNRKAFALLELRDMKTGSTKQEKLRSNEKVEKVFVSTEKVVYLYEEGDTFVFQNPSTFDSINVPAALIEGNEKFLLEGVEAQLQLDENGHVLTFVPPKKVTCTVESLGGGGGKIAELDIGVQVQVPPFVQPGDRIVVDTEELKYLSRATDDD